MILARRTLAMSSAEFAEAAPPLALRRLLLAASSEGVNQPAGTSSLTTSTKLTISSTTSFLLWL